MALPTHMEKRLGNYTIYEFGDIGTFLYVAIIVLSVDGVVIQPHGRRI